MQTSLVYDAAGGGGYCALLGTSGRVECWGDNHDGELGDGGKEQSSAGPGEGHRIGELS